MHKYKISRIMLVIFLFIRTAFATSSQKLELSDNIQKETLQDVIVITTKDWLIIPHCYFTPETRIAYGLVFLTYFQDIIMTIPPIKLRPSTLAITFTHTQNDQFIFQIFPEFYFFKDKYHIKQEIQYLNYPDKFFGIGQNTTEHNKELYTAKFFSFTNIIERELYRRIYIGMLYHIDIRKINQTEEGKLIDSGQVYGHNGGRASGIGITLNYDNRDDIVFTRDGAYINISLLQYSHYIKSDFDFTVCNLDYRFFEPFWFSHVLAIQLFMGYIHGNAPFYLLSRMGGSKIMRGIYDGRYRDRNVIVTQAEYRIPLFDRFHLCGFGGIGQVASRIRNFTIQKFVYTYGGGIRFKLKKNNNLNLRLDVGCSENFKGIYITIGEAI